MDTEGPLKPAFLTNQYNYVIAEHFSNYILTVPTPKTNPHYAVNSLIHLSISNFGPLKIPITDQGTYYLKSEMANCCTLFRFRHSPGTSLAPWTIGLV